MKHLTKFWLIAALALGGAALVSRFFGLSYDNTIGPVAAVIGLWLVESVVGFFQAQRREIEKLRRDVEELKQSIDLERT